MHFSKGEESTHSNYYFASSVFIDLPNGDEWKWALFIKTCKNAFFSLELDIFVLFSLLYNPFYVALRWHETSSISLFCLKWL